MERRAGEGGTTSSRAQPSSPVQQSPARANHDRATRQVVGSRSESDGPDTWTEPCADTVPDSIEGESPGLV